MRTVEVPLRWSAQPAIEADFVDLGGTYQTRQRVEKALGQHNSNRLVSSPMRHSFVDASTAPAQHDTVNATAVLRGLCILSGGKRD
jgi:hypothetical protein